MKKTLLRSTASIAAALLSGLILPNSASAVVEIYNTQTSFNWVCPPGVTNLQVECWGGGGGSSLVDTNFTLANAGGGGGGGGAYAMLMNVPVTPGNFYNITIPAAATPTTTGFTNNQRFDGSDVTFTGDSGITVTANGGKGGQCKITQGTALTGQVGNGGAAGVGYDVAWPGGTSANWSAGNGSGGGGGAGDQAGGGGALAANGSFGAGGTGSDPAHTGGNGGAARNGVGAGNNATSPGGGGGGAKSTTTSTGVRKGGNGGLGQIILTYTSSIPPVPMITQVYNTATNFNWVCPAGVSNILVECWGGGGAGGGAFNDATNGGAANAGGGGGGGGAYASLTNVPVTPGNSYNITIPAAAVCPSTGFTNNQRYDGSAVSFTGNSATTVTANGGQGGQCTIVTDATATSGGAGAGGVVGTGDVVWAGGDATFWGAGNGAGGGGGAGNLAAGGSPAAANGSFGAGGTGSDPSHKGGDGGAASNGAGVGSSASTPGGGGAGAKSTTATPNSYRGGNGGSGQIILTWVVPTIAEVVKANNADNLNLGTSWVGGTPPNGSEIAKWNSTVSSANTTLLGADVSWAGIIIADPTGLVTINAGNTLTLGGVSTNIDMNAAAVDLTLNCGVALGSANVWDVQSGRTLTVGGAVSGPGSVAVQNAGTVVLSSSANSYSGNTTVGTTSTLKLGAANVVPNGDDKGSVTVDGTLDLNAFSETLNGLSGSGTVDTVAGGTPTLTLGSTNYSATFTGVIQDTAGTLSLTKTSTSRQDLVGANTFSGPVLVNQGWLVVGESNAPLANVPSITVADGATFGAYGAQVDIDVPVTLGAGNPTINIVAPIAPLSGGANTVQRNFRLNAGITGNGDVVFKGVNPYNWSGVINVSNCTYTGSTLMTCDLIPGITLTNNNNVIVQLLSTNGLPATTVLTMDGDIGPEGASGFGRYCDLFLNGFPQTLAGLTNVTRTLRVQRIINRDSQGAATFTLNNSADYEFSGWLGASSGGSLGSGNAGNNLDFVKTGTGTFTLSKTNGNTYANGTTINGGTLLVNNLTGSGTGTGDVTVNSGGTLGGTGSISGNVTVNTGGQLAPGASIGTLAVGGLLTLSPGSTNTFEVNGTTPANDEVVLGSSVIYGGVLRIVPTGTFTNGQTFTLFSGAGATDPSNFASIVSSSGTFSFANGVLTVVSAPVTSPTPESITRTVSGGNLILSWTQPGWNLATGTNVTAITNIIPGATSPYTNSLSEPKRFYRLMYP